MLAKGEKQLKITNYANFSIFFQNFDLLEFASDTC